MEIVRFEWDKLKDLENQVKHGMSFHRATLAFYDPQRVIAEDRAHSRTEPRFFCYGRVGEGVATVRFTIRRTRIRVIGAGYWRAGREIYEKENRLH